MNLIKTTGESRIETYIELNKISLINKNLIEVIACGDVTIKEALLTKEAYLKLLAEANEDIAVLIDLNKAGKSTPEARKIWKEMGDHDKNRKVAFIGLNTVARVIASFTITFSENKNMKFFATREEALKWLGRD